VGSSVFAYAPGFHTSPSSSAAASRPCTSYYVVPNSTPITTWYSIPREDKDTKENSYSYSSPARLVARRRLKPQSTSGYALGGGSGGFGTSGLLGVGPSLRRPRTSRALVIQYSLVASSLAPLAFKRLHAFM